MKMFIIGVFVGIGLTAFSAIIAWHLIIKALSEEEKANKNGQYD